MATVLRRSVLPGPEKWSGRYAAALSNPGPARRVLGGYSVAVHDNDWNIPLLLQNRAKRSTGKNRQQALLWLWHDNLVAIEFFGDIQNGEGGFTLSEHTVTRNIFHRKALACLFDEGLGTLRLKLRDFLLGTKAQHLPLRDWLADIEKNDLKASAFAVFAQRILKTPA